MVTNLNDDVIRVSFHDVMNSQGQAEHEWIIHQTLSSLSVLGGAGIQY